ncbi:hypothetical protein FB451DRAFT_1027873, partial [Mycena latifolia]
MAAFLIIVMGDLNARTASSKASPLDPERASKDEKESTRGRWLARMCKDYNIMFVSGTARFGPESGNFTSFQGSRETVIDYMLCSRPLFESVEWFRVGDRVEKFDHAPLSTEINV